MASHDGDRVAALSLQLARAHHDLRRRIGELKAGLGRRRWSNDVLADHCLAFCAVLTAHHQGEDGEMFAQLRQARPDLAATITKLVEDHGMIAHILSRVTELADHAVRSPDRAREAIQRELDGLGAILESHFRYEERAIGTALDDGIPDTGWSDMVFRFRQHMP